MALTKKQRANFREMFGGKCAYCGCELPENGWHADHVEPIYRGRDFDREITASGKFEFTSRVEARKSLDVVQNMMPSCRACNLFKGGYTLEGFRYQVSQQALRARLYSVNFRTAERFGQVKETATPILFWFERYAGESHER